jgi:hypothetical protein
MGGQLGSWWWRRQSRDEYAEKFAQARYRPLPVPLDASHVWYLSKDGVTLQTPLRIDLLDGSHALILGWFSPPVPARQPSAGIELLVDGYRVNALDAAIAPDNRLDFLGCVSCILVGTTPSATQRALAQELQRIICAEFDRWLRTVDQDAYNRIIRTAIPYSHQLRLGLLKQGLLADVAGRYHLLQTQQGPLSIQQLLANTDRGIELRAVSAVQPNDPRFFIGDTAPLPLLDTRDLIDAWFLEQVVKNNKLRLTFVDVAPKFEIWDGAVQPPMSAAGVRLVDWLSQGLTASQWHSMVHIQISRPSRDDDKIPAGLLSTATSDQRAQFVSSRVGEEHVARPGADWTSTAILQVAERSTLASSILQLPYDLPLQSLVAMLIFDKAAVLALESVPHNTYFGHWQDVTRHVKWLAGQQNLRKTNDLIDQHGQELSGNLRQRIAQLEKQLVELSQILGHGYEAEDSEPARGGPTEIGRQP